MRPIPSERTVVYRSRTVIQGKFEWQNGSSGAQYRIVVRKFPGRQIDRVDLVFGFLRFVFRLVFLLKKQGFGKRTADLGEERIVSGFGHFRLRIGRAIRWYVVPVILETADGCVSTDEPSVLDGTSV